MPAGRIRTYLFPSLVFGVFCIGLLVALSVSIPEAVGILGLPLVLGFGFLAVCLFDLLFGGGAESTEEETSPPS